MVCLAAGAAAQIWKVPRREGSTEVCVHLLCSCPCSHSGQACSQEACCCRARPSHGAEEARSSCPRPGSQARSQAGSKRPRPGSCQACSQAGRRGARLRMRAHGWLSAHGVMDEHSFWQSARPQNMRGVSEAIDAPHPLAPLPGFLSKGRPHWLGHFPFIAFPSCLQAH